MPKSLQTTVKTNNVDEKVKIAPIRLLNESQVQSLWDELCQKCQSHC